MQYIINRAAFDRFTAMSGTEKHPIIGRLHLRTAFFRTLATEILYECIQVDHQLTKGLVEPNCEVVIRGIRYDASDVGGIVT